MGEAGDPWVQARRVGTRRPWRRGDDGGEPQAAGPPAHGEDHLGWDGFCLSLSLSLALVDLTCVFFVSHRPRGVSGAWSGSGSVLLLGWYDKR